MVISSYKNLTVWAKSMELAKKIYKTTEGLPKEEVYGLSAQMRRAAISIPSNIAEGSKRKDLPEYLHFLRISAGSAAELETQILIVKSIYPKIDAIEILKLNEQIQKMLYGLISKLKEKL